jgi:hypothetical protein
MSTAVSTASVPSSSQSPQRIDGLQKKFGFEDYGLDACRHTAYIPVIRADDTAARRKPRTKTREIRAARDRLSTPNHGERR